jgi:outer membrane lipoprotein carrier protein
MTRVRRGLAAVVAPLVTAAALVTLVPAVLAGNETTAGDLAQALQHRYDSIKDFSADFVHQYQGGVLRKAIAERGHVLIKKPGKMRWEYAAPEKKLFVSDGVRIYSYIPEDKQVVVSPQPRDEQTSAGALFLAGKGNLTRDFTPSFIANPKGTALGARSLKMVPKTPQPEYEWLIFTVDPATLAIQGLLTRDAQGGESAFIFTNLKENTGLADKEFAFSIPRGVDVVTDSSR